MQYTRHSNILHSYIAEYYIFMKVRIITVLFKLAHKTVAVGYVMKFFGKLAREHSLLGCRNFDGKRGHAGCRHGKGVENAEHAEVGKDVQ